MRARYRSPRSQPENATLPCQPAWAGRLSRIAGDATLVEEASALALVGATTLLSALVGRALFYVLVVPTTMPGAFFWKNKAFEQHARDIGLASMPQVGVAPHGH